MPGRTRSAPPPTKHRNADLVPEGKRPCPICGKAMKTTRRGADSLDVCKDHGIWLDKDELARMFQRRTRSFERRLNDAKQQAQRHGFFWGALLL